MRQNCDTQKPRGETSGFNSKERRRKSSGHGLRDDSRRHSDTVVPSRATMWPRTRARDDRSERTSVTTNKTLLAQNTKRRPKTKTTSTQRGQDTAGDTGGDTGGAINDDAAASSFLALSLAINQMRGFLCSETWPAQQGYMCARFHSLSLSCVRSAWAELTVGSRLFPTHLEAVTHLWLGVLCLLDTI